jgi:putative ABC transport system permease protein
VILANLSLALEAVRRNTLRSVLTMLGVVIGVAAVVMMVTLGQSASAKITGEVASLGNNLLIVSPGRRQNGPPSGPMRPFDLGDVAAMEAAVGADGRVAPESMSQTAVIYGSANHLTTLRGVTPAYLEVRGYDVAEGRTIYEADVRGGSLVCLIGVTTQTGAVRRPARARAVGAPRPRAVHGGGRARAQGQVVDGAGPGRHHPAAAHRDAAAGDGG